jgi:hypothetical protein
VISIHQDIMESCSVLLSNSEVDYLIGKKKCSKSFEYKIKSSIKKKINKLVSFDVPFLIENGLIDKRMVEDLIGNTNITNNMLLNLGKEKVAGPKVWKHAGIPAQGSEFCNKSDDYHYLQIANLIRRY